MPETRLTPINTHRIVGELVEPAFLIDCAATFRRVVRRVFWSEQLVDIWKSLRTTTAKETFHRCKVVRRRSSQRLDRHVGVSTILGKSVGCASRSKLWSRTTTPPPPHESIVFARVELSLQHILTRKATITLHIGCLLMSARMSSPAASTRHVCTQ